MKIWLIDLKQSETIQIATVFSRITGEKLENHL